MRAKKTRRKGCWPYYAYLLRWPIKRSRLPVSKHSRLDFIFMPKARKLTPSAKPSDLFEDIRALIEQARAATARVINSAVT